MDKVSIGLQVFFEDPFYVGLLERVAEEGLTVCKVTFGAEPKEQEILQYILSNYDRLCLSPAVEVQIKKCHSNPKRKQREARKQIADTGIGTKSQQALSLQHEQMKKERSEKSKQRREAQKEYLFELKQQKRKEKHRGR